MHHSVFAELSFIIAIATGISLLMRLLRQPLIIGHIITGIIVGPALLNLVKSPETIEIFSNIGITLLLFIIGLGLNPKVIKEVGKVAGITASVQVIATVAFAYGGGLILGFSKTEAFFFGIALAFSSTIIILKLLSDKKEQNRLYGKIAIGILLVQDVLATIALIFVTSKGESGFTADQLLILVLKGILIVTPIMFIGNVVVPKLNKLIAGSQEFLFLFAIGWGFGVAALFEITGFSIEIGALVAGVSLASLPFTQEISARLRPLRDFFIIVFFIALGTRIQFGNISETLPIILIATAISVVFKPLIIMIMMGLLSYTKRTSFKTAISMAQISEFSLVFIILANRKGLVDDQLVGTITMVALITIAISAYLIIYSDKIFSFSETFLALFERRKTHFEQESKSSYDLVLFGYNKGGHEFINVFKSLSKKFVVIDYDPEIIDTLERRKIDYLYGDAMDIELLEETGLDKSKLIVSTITDHETNKFLIKLLEEINSKAVVILHGETVDEAAELYELGASYVIIPHYIGSEKIGSFIKKSGLKKSEFRKYREKHLAYLESHFSPTE